MKILIKERMKEMGISHGELAEKMGISQSSLTKRLNGYSQIRLDFLKKLADALDISVVSLIEDERCERVGSFTTEGKSYEIRKIN